MNLKEIEIFFIDAGLSVLYVPYREMCISGQTQPCELRELLSHCKTKNIPVVMISPMTVADFLLYIYEDFVLKEKRIDLNYCDAYKSDQVKSCEALSYCLRQSVLSQVARNELLSLQANYDHTGSFEAICSLVVTVAKKGYAPRFSHNLEWVGEVVRCCKSV